LSLDRDAVVRAGLELLNEVGIDGLTTRRLAERLGVKQPALYWHFKNKRELLDAMAAQMLEWRSPVPITSANWQEALKEDGRSFRRALLRYRDGARVHAGTRPAAGLFASLDGRVRVLCEVGFAPADALRALMIVGRYVVGWVIEEQAEQYDGRPQVREDFMPDPAVYPVLAAGVAVLRNEDQDTGFDFGLDALVRGFAARIGPEKRGRRGA
jgi:TetR/AcrR family tetracycline transcriptional repressor